MTDADPAGSRPRTVVLGAVAVGLTVAGCLVGALGWPVPERTTSGWQVAAVPGSLLVLVIGAAVVSLAVGTLLVRPTSLRSPVATVTWWSLGLASGFAQVWNDLYAAALGGGGAVIPVLGWLFTFTPALLMGWVTRRSGRAAHLRATVGTGVVTLPMVGLGWALYASSEGVPAGPLSGLWSTGILGVLPLLVAVAMTRPPASWTPALTGR
jgi:hypothetical protein